MNCQTHEDGDTISYTYDSTGRLATVVDSATGRTTTYTYDFADRTAKYTETGANYSHSVEYGYDETGKLISQTEIINGVTHSTSYEYDDDNRVTSKTTDGITVEYTYDSLGRVTQQVTKNGDTTVKTETYTFNASSAQVATYRTQVGSYDVTYTYTYDDNGNILTVYDGTNTTSYVYDSQNQLIRENNQSSGFTRTWTYDNAGNILSKKQYSHTTGELGEASSNISYGYGDKRGWGDLLTTYGGQIITYDEIGNPLTWGTKTFTWEHGRQLAAISISGMLGTYTYDVNGMRTARTYGATNYKYIYNGSQLVQMEYHSGSTNVTLAFTYDAQGTPVSFTANGVQFYYLTNLQGDVVGITNASGGVVARYTYDAWGTCAVSSNNLMGQVNPLRYRGYVYDVETELYYLQSRYYDPAVGRFINADDVIAGASGSIQGNNTFVYCFNNSVNMHDKAGNWPDWAKRLAKWVDKNIIEPVVEFAEDIIEDCKNFDLNNTSEQKVLESNYFSAYKGVPVVRTNGSRSGSYGIIFLTRETNDRENPEDMVRHEYGHTRQLARVGLINYTIFIAIPSMLNLGEGDYYSKKWEVTADLYGGVQSRQHSTNSIVEGIGYLETLRVFHELMDKLRKAGNR